jgi:LPS sulfotransferase NodH
LPDLGGRRPDCAGRSVGGQPRQGRPDAELVLSFRAINYLVRLLTAHDASWDAYFLGLGSEPLKVTYEELARGTTAVAGRVLEYLEIERPERLDGAPPRLAVQADELSERWVELVRGHVAALEMPAPASWVADQVGEA